MRLKRLLLKNFGPFREYDISFIPEDNVCMLLTGKNNEGKSNLIFALKLVDAATRVISKSKQRLIDENDGVFYRLLQQDIAQIDIGRVIHNYSKSIAEIHAEFTDNIELIVYLDPNKDAIFADYTGYIPKDIGSIFGFVPPLGPLSEQEELLTLKHLKSSLNTSLSPHHFRNHLKQLLIKEELELVRDIIQKSWSDVEILTPEYDSKK